MTRLKINIQHGVKTLLGSLICLLFVVSSCTSKSDSENELIFAKGKKDVTGNFQGNVWLKSLVEGDSTNQNSVGSVTFEAGSRTKWHSHPAGQIILALSGEGYYQEKGGIKKILRKGDVVKCPANIPHWHGASRNNNFIQIAITGREKGPTAWFEEVSDSQYHAD